MKRYFFLLSLVLAFAISSDSLTPPKGSKDRIAILNTLRSEVKYYHHIDVIFVVKHLRVKDGLAWVETSPMSKDGKNHYEDVIALLHSAKGTWRVKELVCTEVETQGCIDDPDFFGGLKKRFPQVPSAIVGR